LFLKNNYWILRDRVSAAGSHAIKLMFHAVPGAILHAERNVMQISLPDSPGGLWLTTFAPGGAWNEESGWVSPCYGQKFEAPVAAYSVTVNGPSECLTVMIPAGNEECSVERIEAVHGTALRINYGERHDLLLSRGTGKSGSAETERFFSDFDFTWASFADREASLPDQVILVGGQDFKIDGEGIVAARERIDYLVVHRSGDRFTSEQKN